MKGRMRTYVTVCASLLLGILLATAPPTQAHAGDRVDFLLTWPIAGQEQLAGECMLEASYDILQPGITLDSAGFYVNGTPFAAASYWDGGFDVMLDFKEGEYSIVPYLLDTGGNTHTGNTVTLTFLPLSGLEDTNWDDIPGIESIPGTTSPEEQVFVELIWPEEDHVRPEGTYLLDAGFEIFDPAVSFGSAGFYINNVPYHAATYQDGLFGLEVTFKPGEYNILPFVVDADGIYYYGNPSILTLREIAVPPPEIEIDVPPFETPPTQPNQPETPGTHSLHLPTESFQLYIEFSGWIPQGSNYGSFYEFPDRSWPGQSIKPQITWDGNRFEGTLIYKEPGPELVDNDRGGSAQHEWTHTYRVWGQLAPDHSAMEITFNYSGECRRIYDGKLWEYYRCHFALTDVPGKGEIVKPVANPYAGTSSTPYYAVKYGLEYHGNDPRDHLLELNYGHGYPEYPETVNELTTAKITDVKFTFNGW